jgi:hypothetical protein
MAENETIEWESFVEKLSDPVVDEKHTLAEYLELDVTTQAQLKNMGFYLGGHTKDGRRRKESLLFRSIVNLDIDYASSDELSELFYGLSPLCDRRFFLHSTRKHTTEKPRLRIIIPLLKPISPEKYAAVSRFLATELLPDSERGIEVVDAASFRAAQMMFYPTVCKDGEFLCYENEGEFLDADKFLKSHPEWRDYSKLPRAKREKSGHISGDKKPQDPRTKHGVIGAFCRVYDVEEAITTFLPEVYTLGDESSEKPRYTFVGSSGANGAIVEDGGLYLYSHHESDPAFGQLLNAFDLVRIHKFGDLDEDTYENTSEAPSYGAMMEFCRDLPELEGELTTDVESMFDILDPKDDEDSETLSREWPLDLGFFLNKTTPAPKFPTEVLGEFWEDQIRRWATGTSSPLDFAVGTLLTSAAALIGTSRSASPKPGWTEPCILWGCLVGYSSQNKTPAADVSRKILDTIGGEWNAEYAEAKRVYDAKEKMREASRKEWMKQNKDADVTEMPDHLIPGKPPQMKKIIVDDGTPESIAFVLAENGRGLLQWSEELRSWFDNMTRYSNATNKPFWLNAYGGRSLEVTRKSIEGISMHVPRLSLSLFGGIQPDVLRERLCEAEDSDDGLVPRMLFFYPPNAKFRLTRDPVRLEEMESAYRMLATLPEATEPLPFSDAAWDKFWVWHDNHAKEDESPEGLLRSAFGKSPGHVIRLALVLEHLWWAEPFNGVKCPSEISLKAVEAAIRIREEYIVPMQRRTFTEGDRTQGFMLARRLASWILKSKETNINQRSVRRSRVLRTDDVRIVSGAFETLEAYGVVAKDRRTRKSDYIVNPLLWENEDEIKRIRYEE